MLVDGDGYAHDSECEQLGSPRRLTRFARLLGDADLSLGCRCPIPYSNTGTSSLATKSEQRQRRRRRLGVILVGFLVRFRKLAVPLLALHLPVDSPDSGIHTSSLRHPVGHHGLSSPRLPKRQTAPNERRLWLNAGRPARAEPKTSQCRLRATRPRCKAQRRIHHARRFVTSPPHHRLLPASCAGVQPSPDGLQHAATATGAGDELGYDVVDRVGGEAFVGGRRRVGVQPVCVD